IINKLSDFIEGLSDEQLKIADFNNNGKVDTLDALKILKRVAGIIPPTIEEKDFKATSEFVLREENAYKYVDFYLNLINKSKENIFVENDEMVILAKNVMTLNILYGIKNDIIYNLNKAGDILKENQALEQFIAKKDFDKLITDINIFSTELDKSYEQLKIYNPDSNVLENKEVLQYFQTQSQKALKKYIDINSVLKKINNLAKELIGENNQFNTYYKKYRLNFDEFIKINDSDIIQGTLSDLIMLISKNFSFLFMFNNGELSYIKAKQDIEATNVLINNFTKDSSSASYIINPENLKKYTEKSIEFLNALEDSNSNDMTIYYEEFCECLLRLLIQINPYIQNFTNIHI
ncbi:MAG: hypothetical protein RR549_01775, partial [Oscillospiraceae bacterium]